MDKVQEKREFLADYFKNNYNNSAPDEFSGSIKDSSLKKTSSLLKKLKQVQTDQLESLLVDIKQINLSMHLSEVSLSIFENKPKTAAEIMCIAHLIIAIMCEFSEFRQSFVVELWKKIANEMDSLDVSDKANISGFRWLLRLSMELHVMRVYNGNTKIASSFTKLFLQENESIALKLVPLASYFIKNFDFGAPAPGADQKGKLAAFDNVEAILEKYFKYMCRYLARLQKSFLSIQERAKQHYESRGDLSQTFSAELTDAFSRYREAFTSLEALALSMNRSLPEAADSKQKFEVIDGKIIFSGDLCFLLNKNTQIFEDEEQRLFYEDLPSYSRIEGASTKFSSPPSPEEPEEFDENAVEEIDPDAVKKTTIFVPKEVEELSKAVEALMSKNDADQIAKTIVEKSPNELYKFIDMLCAPLRKRMELVPLFVRICAISAVTHPKLVSELIKSIIGQFTFLIHRKEAIMGTRRRICRFVGELTKFKLMSQSQVYYCLKVCVKDFTGPNIDMFCMIVEYCGRFIYLQPESHARIAHLFKVVNNKRINTLDVSSDRQIAISNALFMVDPQPFNFSAKVVDQKELYLNLLMSSDLNDIELTNLLLESDWNDKETVELLLYQFLQPWLFKTARSEIHTLCLVRLKQYYPTFVTNLIDRLLDMCSSFVEIASPLLPQQMVSLTRFVSRLFNCNILDEKVVFTILNYLICFNHDISAGITSDGPSEHLRVKLVACLLEPCVPTLKSYWPQELTDFLALFRCYICSKVEISREIFEQLTDLFQMAQAPLLPLSLIVARNDYSEKGGPSRILLSKLDFLNQDANADPTYSGPIGQELLAPQNAEMEAELDREMAKLVCHGLEQRKLERRPQNFETSIPLAMKSATQDATSAGKINLMLKKGYKNKSVFKQVSPQ